MIEHVERILTFGGKRPHEVARTTVMLTIFLFYLYKISRFFAKYGFKGSRKIAMMVAFNFTKRTVGKSAFDKQMQDAKKDMAESLIMDVERKEKANFVLPDVGMKHNALLSMMRRWAKEHKSLWNGEKQLASGTVYYGKDDMRNFQNEAYSLFSLSNPLHPDCFPFTRKMESEVISMTCDILNGGDTACGVVSSGGTESIICAIRAYRNWARATKGITQPNFIAPLTAHAAFDKGCEMLGVELIHIPVDQKTFTIDPKTLLKHITPNTIAFCAGAPSYAQGVIDPVEELAEIAIEKKIGFHVDCCLGSFLLCSLPEAGYPVDPFDFRVPGVTSISIDTHKYGFAAKGSSVLCFSNFELRRYCYFMTTQWTGGVYGTPTIQGSRSGGVIAQTWAAMMAMGRKGYVDAAKEIMHEVGVIRKGVEEIPELQMHGDPISSVVAFGTTQESGLNCYAVASAMTKRGWCLNKLQNPPSVHICVTYIHLNKGKEFVKVLKEVVTDVRKNPGDHEGGDVALYGTMASLPDGMKEGVMDEVVSAIWDVLLAPLKS